MSRIAPIALSACLTANAFAADLPIFDTHVHYGLDVWEAMSPKEAVAILRRAGIRAALVSSADDDGTLMLSREAPELVVPALSPYRKPGELASWLSDDSVPAYLEERLSKARYVAIGEFHAYGDEAVLPVFKRVVQIAKTHRLYLHADSDDDAIEHIFRHDPDARVIWAHAGFEPVDRVLAMLRKHRNLWCDLAMRGRIARGGKVNPEWRAAFVEFPDRFMVGTDTFSAERWREVEADTGAVRKWLNDLPPEIAERIAHKNAEALFSQ
ncbi:MAG: amidohydrolase family protein [Hyphomicrobiaceae bacterium]|nr:amidohydrolase family protein [Hyphomicrobiaceae bacterium]